MGESGAKCPGTCTQNASKSIHKKKKKQRAQCFSLTALHKRKENPSRENRQASGAVDVGQDLILAWHAKVFAEFQRLTVREPKCVSISYYMQIYTN